MKEIQENSVNRPKTPGVNYTFTQFKGDGGIYLPIFNFFTHYLSIRKISPNDLAVIVSILKEFLFTNEGNPEFPLSSGDLQRLTGLSDRTVRNSLFRISCLGFVSVIPARNGAKNIIKVNVEKLQELNGSTKTSVENAELDESNLGRIFRPGTKTSVENAELDESNLGSYYRGKNQTSVEFSEHLFGKVFNTSSSKLRPEKHSQLNFEMRQLMADGVGIEYIEAALDTMSDLNWIKSFKKIILGKLDQYPDLIQEQVSRKIKLEAERRERDQKQIEESSKMPELKFVSPFRNNYRAENQNRI